MNYAELFSALIPETIVVITAASIRMPGRSRSRILR